MPRYQFQPRADLPSIDIPLCTALAKAGGASRVMMGFPTMYRLDARNYPTSEWLGTNQPPTVRFTCANDDQARLIAEAHVEGLVWNITDRHYV